MNPNCDKCDKPITSKHFMKVATGHHTHNFCIKCIKEGFDTLSKKKNKAPDEVLLAADFRKFLAEHKVIHEA